MSWLRQPRIEPWRIANVSVGGLLIAIVVAGLLGLVINERVKHVTDRALEYDIELEDRGDDVRVAVLDVRHYHRNILFSGPSRRGSADFEGAYFRLREQISRLARVESAYPEVVRMDRLHRLADEYYSDFRPAIDAYDTNPSAFTAASDEGLAMLSELELAARDIDHFGEQRAAASLRTVDQAADTARFTLLSVLGGSVLLGMGLAYSTLSRVRQQQQTAQQLADALRAKNAFVADASHELRTPLTVLRANAEVALEIDPESVQSELLGEIVRESERMTHLVEDMLMLARSDSSPLPFQIEAVGLEGFFAQLVERARTLAHDRGASLELDLSATGSAEFDRSRIEQVVFILVDNAAKHGPTGGSISLGSQVQSSKLKVEVMDRGPGIPESDLPLIFERFYRVDKSRTRKEGGVGLGLAIARSIIEAHGGWIEALNRPEGGSILRFYLPMRGS